MPSLPGRATVAMDSAVRLLRLVPRLRRIPARLVGIGVRPEHVSLQMERAPGWDPRSS